MNIFSMLLITQTGWDYMIKYKDQTVFSKNK